MARLAQRRGDRFAAMIHLLGVVKLNPAHAEARGRLADVLAAMGQSQRAHGERATYYHLKNHPDQALAELQRIPVSSEPDDRDRTLTRIRLLRETRQTAAALKEAQAGLRRHPGDPQLMLQLGLMYQPGEWRTALEQLCRITCIARDLGGVRSLTGAQTAELEAIRGVYAEGEVAPCCHCGRDPRPNPAAAPDTVADHVRTLARRELRAWRTRRDD